MIKEWKSMYGEFNEKVQKALGDKEIKSQI